MIEKWRAEGARIDAFHATMGTGYYACADELAALLAAVPAPAREEQNAACQEDEECNPFIASCGTKFCTFEGKTHHERKAHSLPAPPGDPPDREAR